MPIRPAATLAALLAAALVPSSASASQFVETIVSSETAFVGTCHDALRESRAGVVHRRLTPTANGLVRARLGGGAGDWDVAVFESATGRLAAASAHFGTAELAEGAVVAGRPLVVQACRRAGASRTVGLEVSVLPLGTPSGERVRIARVRTPNEFAREAVGELGFDDTHHFGRGFIDVVLHGTSDLVRLTQSGLGFDILVEDLVAADRAAAGKSSYDELPEPLPSGRVQYRRMADYGDDMKRLASENPQYVKPITLNHTTLEGRPVEGIEIARDVNARDGKPIFLIMGVHHAREWPSSELTMEWGFELVNGLKANDERVSKLMDRLRVIVVPLTNSDGFNLSRESVVDAGQPVVDPSFAYKRKNCRIVDFAVPAEGECGLQANRALGTDPNRNYGGNWGGPGASDQKISDTYRGGDPFSEPETRNIRELISSRQVVALITNHTYGDLILRPPGVEGTPPTPEDAAYKQLGAAMAAETGYANLYSWELYNTTGTTEDWSYYATGGFGFTFETGAAYKDLNLIGVGFHPPYPTVALEWSQNKYGLGGGHKEAYYKISQWAAEAKNHSVLKGKAPAGSVIRLRKDFETTTSEVVGEHPRTGSVISFKDSLDSSMVVPAAGMFEFHTNPSSRPLQGMEAYQLTCESSSGSVLGRQQVVVGRGEAKDLGVLCAGEGLGPTARQGSGLVLNVVPRRAKLRKALASGLTVRVDCSIACTVSAKLVADRRTARKLRLSRTMGSGRARGVTAGKVLKVRFSRRARKALSRARRVTLTLRVSASAGVRRANTTRRVTLAR